MEGVSVVVPVYNKQQYLKESLGSLLSDSSLNMEFLLIDDFSTDHSFSILKEIAANDSRIRLFRNPSNLGVSYTRNRGIHEAKGEYIGFFDADDIVSLGFYQDLYQTAIHYRKRPDMVVGNLKVHQGFIDYLSGSDSLISIKSSKKNLHIINPYLPFCLQRHKFLLQESPSCCNKIYHRDFLKGKEFPDYIKEDFCFHSLVSHDAKTVLENEDVYYYYCVDHSERDDSYFSRPTGDFMELIDAYYWCLLKIGDSLSLVNALKEVQCRIFESFLEQCICWEIPHHEKVELVGTTYDYCIHLYPKFQISSLYLADRVSQLYSHYLLGHQNSLDGVKQLEKRLSVLSKLYPRRKK